MLDEIVTISLRNSVDRMNEPVRRYVYSRNWSVGSRVDYLDYGEVCLDWLLRLFHGHPEHDYQTYKERYGDPRKNGRSREEYKIEDHSNRDNRW